MSWIDILAIIVALYSLFKGYRSGLVKQLASLAGIIACILLSGKVSYILLPYLRDYGILPEYLVEPAAYIVSFLLILAVFWLLGYMLQSILESVRLGTLNRLTGAILSLVKWAAILSLAFSLITRVDKNQSLLTEEARSKSHSYKYIQPIAPAIAPYLRFDLGKANEEKEQGEPKESPKIERQKDDVGTFILAGR
jgi:uncharacterized membrane protein required for colicin V production